MPGLELVRRVLVVPLVSALALCACGDSTCKQSDLKDISPGFANRLNDVALGGYFHGDYPDGSMIAVGDGGVIVSARENYGPLQIEMTGAGDLYAALLGPDRRTYVAGAGGTMLGSFLGSDTWEPITTGTTADLYELAWIGVRDDPTQQYRDHQLAVGDEAVLVRDPADDTWDLVPPPDGGWGRLRAVTGEDRVRVAGLGGVIWSAEDPRGAWTREDSGTTVDLLAGDSGNWEPVLVGARGTILRRKVDRWEVVPSAVNGDLIALGWPFGLTSDGRVYDVFLPHEPIAEEWTVPGARSLAFVAFETEIVTVGGAGTITRTPLFCD